MGFAKRARQFGTVSRRWGDVVSQWEVLSLGLPVCCKLSALLLQPQALQSWPTVRWSSLQVKESSDHCAVGGMTGCSKTGFIHDQLLHWLPSAWYCVWVFRFWEQGKVSLFFTQSTPKKKFAKFCLDDTNEKVCT